MQVGMTDTEQLETIEYAHKRRRYAGLSERDLIERHLDADRALDARVAMPDLLDVERFGFKQRVDVMSNGATNGDCEMAREPC